MDFSSRIKTDTLTKCNSEDELEDRMLASAGSINAVSSKRDDNRKRQNYFY